MPRDHGHPAAATAATYQLSESGLVPSFAASPSHPLTRSSGSQQVAEADNDSADFGPLYLLSPRNRSESAIAAVSALQQQQSGEDESSSTKELLDALV